MNCNKNLPLDAEISDICKNQYNYFLNKKGVRGVALGYKLTNGFYTCKKCITVLVEKKLHPKKLCAEDIIPNYFKGIPTDVIESGIIHSNSLTARVRPVINGYSVGNKMYTNAGTCGCLVEDKYLYILSCNHVFAVNNLAPKGSVILQPAVPDGGTVKKDVIGHLNRYVPIQFTTNTYRPENFVDCALCKVISRSFVSPTIAFLGTPKGISKPVLNENVQKVGRMTELTLGKITNISGGTLIRTNIGKDAFFKDQIFTTYLTNDGDSGALLLNKNMYAIGLCIGGSDRVSVCNPIEKVLDSLNVKLVTS